jgi:hypothetical protein
VLNELTLNEKDISNFGGQLDVKDNDNHHQKKLLFMIYFSSFFV